MAASPSISIAIIGSGGAGALTTGDSLLETACAAGWHGLFTRTMGPQIRGGEAAALLRLANQPVESLPDRFDLLIGIDWLNAAPFRRRNQSRTADAGHQRPARRRPAADGNRVRRARRRRADEGDGQGHPGRAPQHDRARHRRPAAGLYRRAGVRADREASGRQGAGCHRGESRRDQGRVRRCRRHRFRHTTRRAEAEHCAPVAAVGQRSDRARRHPRRRSLCRRLSDHAGDRNPRMAGAESDQGRRHAAAGRRRTRRHQHDHRRLLWRHAVADRDLRPRPFADDRSARARHRRGNSGRRHRRHARRTVDRHSHQVRAGRPEYRHLRHARRRTASGVGAAIGRRLRVHDAMGDVSRGSPAGAGDRPVRPVHGSVARGHRTAGRCRLHRRTGRCHRYCRRFLQAPRHDGERRVADGDSGNARRPIYGRRSHPFRARHPDQRRRRPSGPARQAARQARPLQLRRPLGEHRRHRRSCRHHLGLAHRRRARSGRPCGRGWNQGPHDRAAPARAGSAGTDGGRR